MVLQKVSGQTEWVPRQKPEVLAPVGRWEALEAVVAAGANAVYLGGKKLNMRMWRSEFNFTDAELQNAVEYTHQYGVRLYVTLNNLYYEEDLDELREFLEFLEKIQVDALIVQDLAVVNLVQQMGLTRPLHASVQANIHNLESLWQLKEMGFKRVIVSKDLSLEEVYWLGRESGMELESFVHGDLCVAHTGQCLTSSLIFGESSNQGRCLKPCRWQYQALNLLDNQTLTIPGPYVLAMKDLCLYPYLPHLIQAGIVSFKIEGRMREGTYLAPLVRAYREAVDRYWEDPQSYRMDPAVWEEMLQYRVRDYTPGQALDRTSAAVFSYTGEREPHFPGRPIPIPNLTEIEVCQNKPNFNLEAKAINASPDAVPSPRLAVRVGSLGALRAALEAGADAVYVGGEVTTAGAHLWGRREVQVAQEETKAAGARLVLITPKITKRREMGELRRWFGELGQLSLDGLMVSNWGVARLARQLTDLPLYGDYSLNLANSLAMEQAAALGLIQGTVSLEVSSSSLEKLLQHTRFSTEIITHGVLTGMVLDFDLLQTLQVRGPRVDLKDEVGHHYPVEVDQFGRSHIYFPYQLCLLSLLPWLVNIGLASFRLEIQSYAEKNVAQIVRLYRKYLDLAVRETQTYAVNPDDWASIQSLHPAGYTLGALS